jgi:tRNA(Ile2)-agmatinylcytidine synthase
MRIGIDDTDSPAGMCTTYLGAELRQRLENAGFRVQGSLLVRLNPNVVYKTRGNAAVCLEVEGQPDDAFALACACVEDLAEFRGEQTNPGVVVAESPLDPSFYHRAVTDFCTIEEAMALLEETGALYRGWKMGRGLIGATAAVAHRFPDATFELLAYRDPTSQAPRIVDRKSIFDAETATWPHTWDSVDPGNDVVVCVPHTPDPVLFGIRGESPAWVRRARAIIRSEPPVLEQIYRTNQGTDSHLLDGMIGRLLEGRSYRVGGTVTSVPVTGRGGHVGILLGDAGGEVRCMAYEPTKQFRNVVRALLPGDRVLVTGSYKAGSINLEKMKVISLAGQTTVRPPVCSGCGRRMTSAGREKGYKCRRCGQRANAPEVSVHPRSLGEGWYEVPPSARRHLAKPLVRSGQS